MKLLSTLALALFFPAIVAAQNSGIYVQGGPLFDFLTGSSTSAFPNVSLLSGNTTYTWNDINRDGRWQPGEEGSPFSSSMPSLPGYPGESGGRWMPGATAAVGVFITPSISIRAEGSFQTDDDRSDDSSAVFGLASRQSTSVTDVIVAAGWHQGGTRRTTITYLAGMVFRRQHEDMELSYSFPGLPRVLDPRQLAPISIQTSDIEFGSTTYSAGVMAGVDVSFSISEHFAIVPQFRLIAANHDFSLRPAVAMRWRP